MTIEIKRVTSANALKNNFLCERAVRAHGGRSLEFVALLDGEEVGFLSYEDWPDRSQAFIFEVLVLPSFRQQGIGQSLLLHAEKHAIKQGRKTVRLKPYALDQEPDTNRLISWYKKAGYVQSSDEKGVLQKNLAS